MGVGYIPYIWHGGWSIGSNNYIHGVDITNQHSLWNYYSLIDAQRTHFTIVNRFDHLFHVLSL